jgi:4'-phosphopantetheinyl transferase
VTLDAGPANESLGLRAVERGPQDVLLCVFDLDRSPAETKLLKRLLSVSEVDRAAQFLADRDRNHFVVGRGILRSLLGSLSATPATDLQIEVPPDSTKPRLASPARFVFNLSHSEGLGLLAVARSTQIRAVGVDVELIRPNPAIAALTARLFSPAEQLALSQIIDPSERVKAFYECWCRKESFVKGIGTGLDLPLKDFDVPVGPTGPSHVVGRRNAKSLVAGWVVYPLQIAAQFSGAVSVLR